MENSRGKTDKGCGWISGWTLQQSDMVLWLAATVQKEAVTLAGGRHFTILLTGTKESLLALFISCVSPQSL